MTNKDIIKKQIIYRSIHRGTKEMDLLLGTFVKKNIEKLNEKDLKDLNDLLIIDDEKISDWYFKGKKSQDFPNTKIAKIFKSFKL
tara:strand:+ start:353 stop:607 length:255 start_codon:yes stop_codon:yes gene_type:complete